MSTGFDLTGQKIGRWTAVALVATGKRRKWLCRCECGRERVVCISGLLNGRSRSCGLCCRPKQMGSLRHGHSHGKNHKGSPTYMSWLSMRHRCLNPKQKGFAYYGARGITICDRWVSSFDNFLADMGERIAGTTLDRIDTYGNYEPDNCRWATYLDQRHNRRDSRVAA